MDLLLESGCTQTGYVKLTENARQIVAELASAQVGRALGLRIPQPFVAVLDTKDLRPEFQSRFTDRGRMVCFASKQAGKTHYSLERAPITSQWRLHAEIGFDLAGTVSFDEFIANADRHLGNIVYAPDSREFWLIDHGRALAINCRCASGLISAEVAVGNRLADESSHSWDDAQKRAILKAATELVLRSDRFSMKDLDMDKHFARIDPSTDREEIIKFFSERLEHMAKLICDRLGMDSLLLRPPARLRRPRPS